ncbi:unnamed protein product [Prorocentrum cordatum]|uniref:Uncharacterized protein n=1 Tax=Prorocentrum cordatum TaxID=2364126 RepID=A0ABN9U1P7_9DINO|nr:unnamed protein product [Polarella glacialis]
MFDCMSNLVRVAYQVGTINGKYATMKVQPTPTKSDENVNKEGCSTIPVEAMYSATWGIQTKSLLDTMMLTTFRVIVTMIHGANQRGSMSSLAAPLIAAKDATSALHHKRSKYVSLHRTIIRSDFATNSGMAVTPLICRSLRV